MKNYLSRREGNDFNYGLGFWEDPFEEFFRPMFFGDRRSGMRTDIKETDKAYELAVDLPGFEKSDIKVNLKDGYLTVEAAKSENEEDGKNYLRRERNYSCSRTYYVGEGIERKDVKAKYNNGTLSLTVPKKNYKELPPDNIEID